MRKIVFMGHADTVGTDYAQLQVFEDPITNAELDDWAEGIGMDWAESYGCEEEDQLEECGWWWEEYDSEKHDGIIV